ncbi:MAG: PQQ-binding-like beta-propeller repeat protein [Candidatus Hydrogenedentes bacterium]|nr:PQQ-binding-like beta-propeller repeat protein [Candidatus Hydrogenedentota bacterium]
MKITWMTVAIAFVVAGGAHGGDSPQFRGANRDGRFEEQGLLKSWPDGGPPKVWVATGLGRGFSSASIVQGKIYVTGMLDEQDGYVFVLNTNGATERQIPYGKETLEKQAPGPRSTPTIDGDRLYLLSGLGVLYCIDLSKGEKQWEVNILERFGAENSTWNIAESVLVDGGRVICTPGGKDAVFAALDKMTGETVWATTGLVDKPSYASPAITTHGGRRILVNGTGTYIVGADPDTGALLWSFHQKVPYDIHGVTPLYKDGLLYYVGGDGSGGGALALSPDGSMVTSKWTDTNLDCLHHGVVLVDGYLYGTGYRGGGKLVCLEMKTGKLMWTTEEVRLGVVVYADGMLYIYEGPKTGIVSLVKATSTGFARTGQFTVEEGTNQHWAHPTIANGRLYIRHGDVLIAYDVRAS